MAGSPSAPVRHTSPREGLTLRFDRGSSSDNSVSGCQARREGPPLSRGESHKERGEKRQDSWKSIQGITRANQGHGESQSQWVSVLPRNHLLSQIIKSQQTSWNWLRDFRIIRSKKWLGKDGMSTYLFRFNVAEHRYFFFHWCVKRIWAPTHNLALRKSDI